MAFTAKSDLVSKHSLFVQREDWARPFFQTQQDKQIQGQSQTVSYIKESPFHFLCRSPMEMELFNTIGKLAIPKLDSEPLPQLNNEDYFLDT